MAVLFLSVFITDTTNWVAEFIFGHSRNQMSKIKGFFLLGAQWENVFCDRFLASSGCWHFLACGRITTICVVSSHGFFFFFFNLNPHLRTCLLILERGEGKERNINWHVPQQRLNPRPTHVPRGIEPAALRSAGGHPTN